MQGWSPSNHGTQEAFGSTLARVLSTHVFGQFMQNFALALIEPPLVDGGIGPHISRSFGLYSELSTETYTRLMKVRCINEHFRRLGPSSVAHFTRVDEIN